MTTILEQKTYLIIRFNFAFGVANTHLIVYMWAVFPQHFWLLYLIEAGFFLSFRFYKLWHKKPLNQALHYLDFCWITNIACYVFFCIVLFIGGAGAELFSDVFRQEFFLLAFGISCGPLFGALLVTPLPLVFHNNEIMASLFIHFFPPLQLYILRWNSSVMKEVWPTFWYDDYDFLNFWPKGSFTGSVFGNSLIFYFAWAVPYMIWQLLIGIDLPKEHSRRQHRPPKWDTVFHFNMRDGQCIWMGKLFWNRREAESKIMMQNNDYEVKDFFVYMLLHFFGVFISIVLLAWMCSLNKYVHAGWLLTIFLITIARGANRYVYYSTKMYTSLVRKQLKALIQDEGDVKKGGSMDGDLESTYSTKMLATFKKISPKKSKKDEGEDNTKKKENEEEVMDRLLAPTDFDEEKMETNDCGMVESEFEQKEQAKQKDLVLSMMTGSLDDEENNYDVSG